MTRLSASLTFACFVFMFQTELSAQSTDFVQFQSEKPDTARVHDQTSPRSTIRLAEPPVQVETTQKLSTASQENSVRNSGDNQYPFLFTRPGDRQWIKSLPIHERPNRPFHVYGNAVREGLLPHGPIGQLVFGK